MTGDELRRRYFTAMRAADKAAVLALFAEDAVAILPDGNSREGKAALDAMFSGIFSQSRPNPSPGPITGAGDYWAVEVETALPDGRTRNTANFFHLDGAGLIARMHSYSRS
jgi:SnoaL-like domain